MAILKGIDGSGFELSRSVIKMSIERLTESLILLFQVFNYEFELSVFLSQFVHQFLPGIHFSVQVFLLLVGCVDLVDQVILIVVQIIHSGSQVFNLDHCLSCVFIVLIVDAGECMSHIIEFSFMTISAFTLR